jgi:hypothetical protein
MQMAHAAAGNNARTYFCSTILVKLHVGQGLLIQTLLSIPLLFNLDQVLNGLGVS